MCDFPLLGESSSEDEFMALNHAYKLVAWLRDLLNEMGLGRFVDEPTILMGDNKTAGKWGREDMITDGNRFIHRMYFKVREGINSGEVEARYINTKLNISDPLTKSVSREVVEMLAPMMSGRQEEPEMPAPENQLIKVTDYMGKLEDHVVVDPIEKYDQGLEAW